MILYSLWQYVELVLLPKMRLSQILSTPKLLFNSCSREDRRSTDAGQSQEVDLTGLSVHAACRPSMNGTAYFYYTDLSRSLNKMVNVRNTFRHLSCSEQHSEV
jgi:hypothetical protein